MLSNPAQEYSDRELIDGCPHDVFDISPIPIQLDGLFYQVNRAGITCKTQPEFSIVRNNTYRYNVVHCVFSGSGSVTVRGRVYPVRRGQLFVLAAHESHAYRSDPDDPLGLAWVEFGGGDSNRIVRYILDAAGPVFSGSVFGAVISQCTAILYHPRSSPGKYDAQISRILYDMLMELCSQTKHFQEQTEAEKEILRYIDENLGSRLTLQSAAAHFGYHPSYFSGRFSKIAGVTFTKYVLQRRMSHACYLLATTEAPVEQIAQQLGFYDVSHFIQRFKAAEGITPSRYRREANGFIRPAAGADASY